MLEKILIQLIHKSFIKCQLTSMFGDGGAPKSPDSDGFDEVSPSRPIRSGKSEIDDPNATRFRIHQHVPRLNVAKNYL